MIEAVNSVLVSAQLLRGNAEQVAQPRVDVSVPVEERAASPVAPYISPYIHVDVNFDKAVLQIRDSDTGDVVRQFPSESTLEARRRVEAQKTLQLPQFKTVDESGQGDQGEQVAAALPSFTVSGGRSFGIDTSAFSGVDTSAGSGVAQAQIAASALASGARTVQTSSTVSLSA